MPDSGHLNAKMKAYMDALSPAARAMLVRTVKAAEARGEGPPPMKALMAAVARLEAGSSLSDLNLLGRSDEGARPLRTDPMPDPAPWSDRLRQAVLQPVGAIAADGDVPVKQVGRIRRASLAPLWTWITRDLLPGPHAEALRAEGAGDLAGTARAFRREIARAVVEALRAAETDPRAWQKLALHAGGDMVARDLRDVVYVLQRDTQFAALVQQLPRQIGPAEVGDAGLLQILRGVVEQSVISAAFVGAVLLQRTASPWLLAQLAVKLTGTSDARLLHTGRYGAFIDVVISEAERQVEILRQSTATRPERAQARAALREFHDILRNLRFGIEVDDVPVWFKRIAAARRDISEVVGREVENTSGLVRRALRVETLNGGFGGGWDADAFEDAEFAVRLLVEARACQDSLALNDLLVRTRKQLEPTLQVLSDKLMADLKSNAALDRDAMLAAVDGSIRLTAIVFGEELAAIQRKSRDLALQRPAGRAHG
ncbi:hypothetical protein [Prosthecomicrobium sp. N25]|uniref:hypothetical protein n=1 Tax=Prosthecomicrobium sp. N25 TaxID=3129254 RepID=UPI003076A2FA